ncbi:hypothetical protein JG687_00006954 [Phytophthora cactorum]|uniref:Secreted protein n=1 Tax=Phytophthora cactorum TaxID=29920 RepID=A0A8T1UHZ9_9STRA|nr:hypothetical protein GQ600_6409 [Phytophthora cactorum]KAG6962768.1 hypothetical protein JG687_00006954 [Phytophthora cactorum]
MQIGASTSSAPVLNLLACGTVAVVDCPCHVSLVEVIVGTRSPRSCKSRVDDDSLRLPTASDSPKVMTKGRQPFHVGRPVHRHAWATKSGSFLRFPIMASRCPTTKLTNFINHQRSLFPTSILIPQFASV